MWTERPRAWRDGLALAATVGFALSVLLGVILNVGHEPSEKPVTSPSCQESVVLVHQGEETLAQCPKGTWIDIVDNNVVCRCGPRREPLWFEQAPPFLPPTPEQPRTDQPFKLDGKPGTEI